MAKNIFIDLELSLDPPIDEVGVMKEHLEKERIPDWMKRQNDMAKYKIFVAKARDYITAGCPQLEQQGKEARNEKYGELTRRAKIINDNGVTEKGVKNLVADFKTFFRKETIEKLVPLQSPSSNQSDDEFVIPNEPPKSLQCARPVPFPKMCEIFDDLDVATDGKDDSLYKLLKVNEREKTADILTKAKTKDKEIQDFIKSKSTDIKADPLNRLSRLCLSFFKDDSERSKYDVAIKRFDFDKFADTTLKLYVDGWITKKKTDWKQYHSCIDEVKKLGYTQEEATWLVYEYFCITKKCLLPEKPKKVTGGWGPKYEVLRSHLVFLFTDSIDYHRLNPKIKNKLQSVIDQFNEDIDPDSVENTIKKILEDLRKFWDSCKYEGIVSIPLFRVTMLPNFPFPKLRDSLQYFINIQ